MFKHRFVAIVSQGREARQTNERSSQKIEAIGKEEKRRTNWKEKS